MADLRYCYFRTSRFPKEVVEKLSPESTVSVNCDEDLTSFNDLFEEESDYDGKSIAQIIFARGSAKFEIKNTDYGKFFICKSHQNELYFKWKEQNQKHIIFRKPSKDASRKTVCSFPEGYGVTHGNRPITTCIATFEEAKMFYKKEEILIHVGLPICHQHKEFLQKYFDTKTKEVSSSSSSSTTTPVKASQSSDFEPREARVPHEKPDQIVTDEVAEAIKNLAKAAGITKIEPIKYYSKLAKDTKRKKIATFKKFVIQIAQFMAPDDYDSLIQHLSNNSKKESKISKQVDNLLNQVEQQYYVAQNDGERNDVLSQVANSFPYSTLLNYFPNLSRHCYSRARKTAEIRKNTWQIPSNAKMIVRYKKEYINFFIEFITGDMVMVGLPFGFQNVHFSNGEKVKIPNTIRKFRDNELSLKFDSHMIEIGRPDVKLSRSKKIEILKFCRASRRVAMQCVDYYYAEGTEAFEILHSTLDKLIILNLLEDSVKKEIKNLLQQAQHYLKTDYRMHVKMYSRCADHCISYALSDPVTKKFSSPRCQDLKDHEHEHDMKCEQCLYCPEAIRKIQNVLDDSISTDDEANEIYYKVMEFKEIVQKCQNKIEALKMHILRSTFSDMERASIIQNLQDGEAFITMDYAQKWIPRKSNQQQRDYYAQKGLSWHICHIYARIKGLGLVQTSVTYLMGFEKQNAKSVITMIRDLLTRLRSWNIEIVSFRSDNASNYRNIELMVNLFAMSTTIGIRIKRYSFSEVQNGKSSGDMECARLKRIMRDYLDAGYNIETPDAMFDALQFGTQKLHSATVIVAKVKGKDCEAKKSLNGITKLSDFTFDYAKKEIRYWQYYGIGKGEIIKFEDYKSLVLNAELEIERETTNTPETEDYIFWRPSHVAVNVTAKKNIAPLVEDNDENIEIDPENDDTSPKEGSIIYCNVNGCQQSFKTKGYFDRHIAIGKHKLIPERCTFRDYALKTYIQQLEGASAESNNLPQLSELLENLDDTEEISCKKGWAIRERAARIIYTDDMKTFLDSQFEDAQRKNQRINPKIVQEQMEQAKLVNNKMRFKVSERLSSIQIGRYFAAKLSKLRNEEINEENSDDDIYHDEPMFSDQFEAICEEIDWTKLVPSKKGKDGYFESEDDDKDEESENEETPKKRTPRKTLTPKTPKSKQDTSKKNTNENEPRQSDQTPRRNPKRRSTENSATKKAAEQPQRKQGRRSQN